MLLDETSGREIDAIAARVLRDAGLTSPPVPIEELLQHVRIHREFYDLADPSFLQRAVHRLRIGKHQLLDLIRKKAKLAAVWLPDEQRILVDTSLHQRKKQWASFHDAAHRLLPWHREYFLGESHDVLTLLVHQGPCTARHLITF